MAQRPTLALSVAAIVAFLSSQASASAISTSVFPNSACAGSSTGAGLVGIGKVTLSNGEVETHCGCPSDNLPAFEACPASANGESVCNSVLDLETGAFTASCGVVACQGAACPKTVVNTVVVDDADCFASGKGALGISTVEGQSKCSCASEAEDFQACPSAANGRASCVSVDNDFLGVAYSNKETVQCGVVCEEGFYLTPSGACTKLSKRDNIYGSAGPIKVGPSMSNGPHRSTGRTHAPHTGATTTTGGVFSTTGPGKIVPTTSYGSHSGHHTHHHHGHHGSHTGSHSGSYSGSITTSASQSGSTSGSYSASHSKYHGHHTHHHSHHNSHHNSHHGSHTTSASESTSTPHGSHTGGSHSASHTHHHHHGHHSGSHSGSQSASHSGHHSHHHSGHHSMSTTTGPSVPTTTIHLTGSIKIGSTTSARTISSHSHARHSHSGHHSGHHGSHTGSHSGFHTTTASASTTGTPGSHTGSHTASHSGHHGHHHSHSGHHSGHHGSHSGSHTGSTSGVFSTTGVTKIVTTTPGSATGTSYASSSTHGSMRHGHHHHGHHTHQPHGPYGSASASASMSTHVPHPKPIDTQPGHHKTRLPHGTTTGGVFSPTTTPIKIGSTTAASSGPSASSRFRARAAPEIVFGSDVCASDERSCASGDFGDFTCVRLDDVTECGGCHSTGDATNCMEIPGILSASCLRGGCVVRACQSGWYQTSEGSCAKRA